MFRSDFRVATLPVALLAVFVSGQANAQAATQQLQQSDASVAKEQGPASLVELAPQLYFKLRRYPKFYGDPNTVDGSFGQRTQLLGNLGGLRDTMTDNGFYADASVTQFMQDNLSGGIEEDQARFNGSADYWLAFDSGKAGLWPGGAFFLHAESSWRAADSINGDTGALVPPNFDAAMPTPNDSETLALPELYYVQALPADWLAIAGKVDWAGLGDGNEFANSERTQFGYAGLVNNPILGAFIPYTSLGLAGIWETKRHEVALLAIQSIGNATSSGFDKFNGDYTYGVQYQYSQDPDGTRPGHYRVLVGYDTKDVLDFAISPRQLLGQIIGAVPVAEKSSNSSLQLNFDQYLWTKGGGALPRRADLSPVGIGIFGRAGWAPGDRNVIDKFYSAGISGYGMLIPGRDYDNWGIGWAATHISSDLRNDTALLNIDLGSFEQAFEVFYNFEMTPAIHLTINAQVIDQTVQNLDSAFTLGARLQLDL